MKYLLLLLLASTATAQTVIELPKTWNEKEVAERLGDAEYKIERDYTQTEGDQFVYYPAKVHLAESSKEIEQLLKEPYSETQEEYEQDKNKPEYVKELEAKIDSLEARISKLEAVKISR